MPELAPSRLLPADVLRVGSAGLRTRRLRAALSALGIAIGIPGIADEDLPFVFDRFYRADSARGLPGSGLGLAIVREVAEAHDGSVTASALPMAGRSCDCG